MNVALIGYPSVGKTTLYQAAARGTAKGSVTSVPVPDPRFDKIVASVRTKKATPATVLFRDDLPSISPTGRALSTEFLDKARSAEALLNVVRAFESARAPYHAPVDYERDRAAVEAELILSDLQIVESRLERLHRSAGSRSPGSPEYAERMLLERVRGPLEAGTPLRDLENSDAELAIARGFQFLSIKPLVVALNVSESEAGKACSAASEGRAFAVCASLEAEIARLDPEDQAEFLRDLGIAEPASDRLIRAIYEAMGLITFFTIGSEIKAWPLRRGSTALKAAATIHTDIARGFIRAEVVHYADWEACGSVEAAHAAGKMRLEGKEYVLQDGDLVQIRNKT
jgi:hypothetical protein